MSKTTKKSTPSQAVSNTMEKSEGALLEFFTDEIKDIYWAENHLTKALPKMSKAATSPKLKKAFDTHLNQTNGHIERLVQVFEALGVKPQAKKCDAMDGIVQEGESIIEDTEEGTATRDVGLILAAQKVEHYEISTYGGLAQIAEALGLEEVKNLLGQTLDEEKATDELLSQIAKGGVIVDSSKE